MVTMFHKDLAADKERLINRLKNMGYLKSQSVEDAFRRVPREVFLPDHLKRDAYRDTPLPIGHGQTISAPHMCVIMCEALHLKKGMTVLEVGAGSGYHAALCAALVCDPSMPPPGHVYTIEIVHGLIEFARYNLQQAGFSDCVTLIHGDGGKGLPEYAPFDRILVAAAAPDIPPPLIDQLAANGIMLIPVGSRGFYQELMMVTKDAGGKTSYKRWGGVSFVPLTGEYGFRL